MKTRTGSNARTIYIEDGERVYPCRCGETHQGLLGAAKRVEHKCFHEPPLIRFGPQYDYVVCASCGVSWRVVEEGE